MTETELYYQIIESIPFEIYMSLYLCGLLGGFLISSLFKFLKTATLYFEKKLSEHKNEEK